MHVVGKNCMHMASMRAVLRSTLVCLALTSGSSPRRAIVGSSTSQSPSQMEHLQIPAPTQSRATYARHNLAINTITHLIFIFIIISDAVITHHHHVELQTMKNTGLLEDRAVADKYSLAVRVQA